MIHNIALALFLFVFSGMLSAQSLILQTTAETLIYKEALAGEEPYISRILVSDRFMRMDYGNDTDSFVLFDRKNKQIFNVVHDDKTILRIRNHPVSVQSPLPLYFSEDEVAQAKPHIFMGKPLTHHRFMSKAKVCRNTLSVEGPMADSVAAMRAFYSVLAGQQALGLANTPKDMLSACNLSLNTFHPVAFLKYGLPVRVWDADGLVRELEDLKPAHPVKPELFDLPKGYEMIEMNSG